MPPHPPLPFAALVAQWPDVAVARLQRLATPQGIAAFVAALPDSGDDDVRAPLSVLRDGCAGALDAGLFASAALRQCAADVRLGAAQHDGQWFTVALAQVDGHAIAISRAPANALARAAQSAVAVSDWDGLDWMTEDSGAATLVAAVLAEAGYKPK